VKQQQGGDDGQSLDEHGVGEPWPCCWVTWIALQPLPAESRGLTLLAHHLPYGDDGGDGWY